VSGPALERADRKVKPFCISEEEVRNAYERVKANKGAGGVEEQSIAAFAERLRQNLYKIWNRMSSGSYFPPVVKPKANGEQRKSSTQTVSDRIAQMVVKARLERDFESLTRVNAYGFRSGKSASEAVGPARKPRRSDRIVALDIRGFLDNLDQNMLMRTVKQHTKEKWIVLYMERWLRASLKKEDVWLAIRDGEVTPLLSALLLHCAFDRWIAATYPHAQCKRSADDVILYCRTEIEAEEIRTAIAAHLKERQLAVHPSRAPQRFRDTA